MTLRPNTYKTVFLLTILTFGIVLAIYAPTIGAIDEPLSLYPDNRGNVGDDDTVVEGTDADAFALVKIYWDSIEPENLLTTTTANSIGTFGTDAGDIIVPEDVAGPHWIIATDGSTPNEGIQFYIDPHIELNPEEGLPDDRIKITGYGFAADADIEKIIFDGDNSYEAEEDVMEGLPDTNENGTFTSRFTVPDVDEEYWPTGSGEDEEDLLIYVEDEYENYAIGVFVVGQYIHVDPDEGYPTWGPVEWEARAEENEDYEVVFVGVDLWISLANVTSDDDGEMSGEFDVPYEAEPGDGDEDEDWGHEYQIELWDEDDDKVAGTEFWVFPEPELVTKIEGIEVDCGRANETVELYGYFFTREDGTEVEVTFDGIDLGTFETDEYGNFEDEFEVPDLEFGHYTIYAVDENGYEAELDFDIRPEGYGEMGTRQSVYFQGDHISFWVNTTDPIDNDEPLILFVNITDPDDVLFYDNWQETTTLQSLIGLVMDGDMDEDGSPVSRIIIGKIFWNVSQLIEGEYHDYYVLPYGEQPLKMMLPDDAKVGTWNWTAYDTNNVNVYLDLDRVEDGDGDIPIPKWVEGDFDVWAEGSFEVVNKLTLDLVLNGLDDMEATIVGLLSDTEGNLMAYIDTKMGTVTASLADLNATIVDIEGDTATLVTDLGIVKADVADIADEFPIEIPDVDLTPMWAAVALSLIAAIAAIAAVVVVYQRIA